MDPYAHRVSVLTWAAIVIVIIGALNWGLVGLFEYDLVAAIFGRLSALSRTIYVIVGVAGIYLAFASTKFR